MTDSLTLSPPNSLILVMDHSIGELPQVMNGELVASTSSCVAVGTLSAPDGPTTITLTDSLGGIEVGELVFEGMLQAPQRELSVCNVNNEKLLTIPVAGSTAKVQIFANDPSEPDEIVVLVQPV